MGNIDGKMIFFDVICYFDVIVDFYIFYLLQGETCQIPLKKFFPECAPVTKKVKIR